MSKGESVERSPRNVLSDADVFFSYFVADNLVENSERLLKRAEEGFLKIFVASEIFDDIVTALRSDKASVETVIEFLEDLRRVPHEVLPMSVEIATEAMSLYRTYGGSRKLHYFDSFHVATAKTHNLPLVTSDHFVLRHSERMGISSIDLRNTWDDTLDPTRSTSSRSSSGVMRIRRFRRWR